MFRKNSDFILVFQCAQDRRVAWRQRLTGGTSGSAMCLQKSEQILPDCALDRSRRRRYFLMEAVFTCLIDACLADDPPSSIRHSHSGAVLCRNPANNLVTFGAGLTFP